MNNIILTAFENAFPLNSFNFLAFRIMKITIPNIDIPKSLLYIIGFYKYIQYIALLGHVPAWLLHPPLLIAVKQDWLLKILV